eukprot:14031-Heterococcus_DN1.PRE.1
MQHSVKMLPTTMYHSAHLNRLLLTVFLSEYTLSPSLISSCSALRIYIHYTQLLHTSPLLTLAAAASISNSCDTAQHQQQQPLILAAVLPLVAAVATTSSTSICTSSSTILQRVCVQME